MEEASLKEDFEELKKTTRVVHKERRLTEQQGCYAAIETYFAKKFC